MDLRPLCRNRCRSRAAPVRPEDCRLLPATHSRKEIGSWRERFLSKEMKCGTVSRALRTPFRQSLVWCDEPISSQEAGQWRHRKVGALFGECAVYDVARNRFGRTG